MDIYLHDSWKHGADAQIFFWQLGGEYAIER